LGRGGMDSSINRRVGAGRSRVDRLKAVEAALKGEEADPDRPSVFEGFTFHLLRHTACSLMAAAGMDPAVAAERAGHTDGGALFLRTYRHLYEAEKRTQALRLEAKILADLAVIWTDGEPEAGNPLNEAGTSDGRNLAVRKPHARSGGAARRFLTSPRALCRPLSGGGARCPRARTSARSPWRRRGAARGRASSRS